LKDNLLLFESEKSFCNRKSIAIICV